MDIEKDAKALLDDAKKQREARDARLVSSPKNKKTKEEIEKEEKAKAEEKAAEQAKKDKEILSKKDEELNDDEKRRKAELVDIKKKEDEKILSTPDDRLDDAGKKRKEELKKAKPSKLELRVHELVDEIGKLKKETKKSSDKDERIKTLEDELRDVKKTLSMSPDDAFKKKVKEDMNERIRKYAEEDKDKPREERREMSKDELDEWIAEDLVSATEWIAERARRREQELARDTIRGKQKMSLEKVLKENPKMDIQKAVERGAELKKEGKSDEEISTIIAEEMPEAAMAFIIAEEQPQLMRLPNAPEILAKEVKTRLSRKPPEKEDTSKIDTLEKELADVKAELERISGLDTGLSSTRSSKKTEEPEGEKALKGLAEEMGLDGARVVSRAKRRAESGGR